MPDVGKDIIEKKKTTIKEIMKYLEEHNKKGDKSHYFYIIEMPSCGGNRIKIGKSSALYSRFKYYQDHFFGSDVNVLRLRKFRNTDVARYTEAGMKLYTLFEREAKYYLRKYNAEVNKKNQLGKLTEWYDAKERNRLLVAFDDFVLEFQRKSFDQIERRKSYRSKNPNNVSDIEEEEEDDEPNRPISNKPITRTSNRLKTPTQKK